MQAVYTKSVRGKPLREERLLESGKETCVDKGRSTKTQRSVRTKVFMESLMRLNHQCRYVRCRGSAQIYNIVGIPFSDLCLAMLMRLPLHSCLFDKAAGLITWWVFKDCTGMSLYWLNHLTIFFVPGN